MSTHPLFNLVHALVGDTTRSIAGFEGELTLCATIVLILVLQIPRATARLDAFWLALAGSLVALYLAGPWHAIEHPSELFTGLLVYDSFTVYFRTLLFFFAVLFVILTRITGVPDRDAGPDIYSLVLGATLGMCVMASANHMLMVFLGVEMASVPSYALAGMLKGRRASSEAALKYAVYGAGTAGIMLYGISLLAGVLGSVHLPTMAERLAELLQPANLEAGIGRDTHMVLALGALMVLVGIAFKLSAVPFHFWCPDVFEGATAEVNAFLSVASKAAALALLARVALGFGYIPQWTEPAPQVAMFNVAEEQTLPSRRTRFPIHPPARLPPHSTRRRMPRRRSTMPPKSRPSPRCASSSWRVLAFVAIITCTFGNMAAYGQTNIKRLLAYSTIAQAGYMIMPVPAAMVLAGENPEAARTAMASMAFYAGVYVFMNLGAFAIVALLRNQLHSEEIADYAGLVRRSPIIAVCFTIILISLIGLPPLAGFAGKLLIFSSLVQAQMWTVLVVAGLNTALSLYYYLRVVKVMTIDPEPEQGRAAEIGFVPGTYIVAITVPVVVLGLAWNRLNELSLAAAQHLF